MFGVVISRLGKDYVVEQFSQPTVGVAPLGRAHIRCRLEFLERLFQHFVRTAHHLYITPGRFAFRQWIELSRVGGIPAEVMLVHRFGVVGHSAVVTLVVKRLVQFRRQPELVGDLPRRGAPVHQTHGLIVDELVGIPLHRQELLDLLLAPQRPVMAAKIHISV